MPAMPRPVANPPNPWQTVHVEWLGPPPDARLEVHEETAREVVTENESPDVGFRYSVNPYRGCFHGCAYCYARPYHEYLDFGAGTDFERKIVVKVNAPEALSRRFRSRTWAGDVLAFSGITDCYQPLEASYGLTRRCLEVCLAYRNPVQVVTKGLLIRRDVDVLARLAREASASVFFTIPFGETASSRKMEPYAPPPAARFETLRLLSEAGIATGIGVAPIIPGLNESDIPALLERARDAGARRAFMILLRLPGSVEPVFRERLGEAFPERVEKVLNAVREMREGRLNGRAFGQRMRGSGPRWRMIEDLFHTTCRRLGLNVEDENPNPQRTTTFRRPGETPGLFASD